MGDKEENLKCALEILLDVSVSLTVTDNTRSMLSGVRKGEVYSVRLHHMFLEADREVMASVAGYLSSKSRSCSEHLRNFIRENRAKIRIGSGRVEKGVLRKRTSSSLQKILARINEEHFGGRADCTICWGNRRTRLRQKTVRLGSYSPRAGLIRINPVLDNPLVPSYVVEDVIFHEMLHHHLGVKTSKGRRSCHHEAFKEMERTFPHRERARVWIRENLSRLLKNRGPNPTLNFGSRRGIRGSKNS